MQAPIRVRAKAGVFVPVPCLHGGTRQFIGRELDGEAATRKEQDDELLYPIAKDPAEFSAQVHGPIVMQEIRRALRDGDLLEERKAPAPAPKTLAQEAAQPKGKA